MPEPPLEHHAASRFFVDRGSPTGSPRRPRPLYKRPGPLRRLWAAAAGSALAIVIGAVLAIVIAFGTGWLVITLTDLLKQ